MPVITVQMARTSVEKKKALIEKLTTATVEVTNSPASSVTIFIDEFEYDSIGLAGQTLAEKLANK